MPVIFVERLIITVAILFENRVIHYLVMLFTNLIDGLIYDILEDIDKVLIGWIPDDRC
jgi:hypothetical protein